MPEVVSIMGLPAKGYCANSTVGAVGQRVTITWHLFWGQLMRGLLRVESHGDMLRRVPLIRGLNEQLKTGDDRWLCPEIHRPPCRC